MRDASAQEERETEVREAKADEERREQEREVEAWGRHEGEVKAQGSDKRAGRDNNRMCARTVLVLGIDQHSLGQDPLIHAQRARGLTCVGFISCECCHCHRLFPSCTKVLSRE